MLALQGNIQPSKMCLRMLRFDSTWLTVVRTSVCMQTLEDVEGKTMPLFPPIHGMLQNHIDSSRVCAETGS